jgi:hypothetical protein
LTPSRRGLWPDAGPHHRPRSAGGTATIANDNLGSKRGGQAKQGGGKIVATYDYFDHITGDFLMQVVRYEPKGFSQRRPDPDRPSEWARTVPAECRTLYNAARAYNAKGVVLIVEGEKDVDNLAEIGVVATCNPGGAEKWQDNYNEILRDKDVVLVPDNDPQLRNKSTGALQTPGSTWWAPRCRASPRASASCTCPACPRRATSATGSRSRATTRTPCSS